MRRAAPLIAVLLAACVPPSTQRPVISAAQVEAEVEFQKKLAFAERVEVEHRLRQIAANLQVAATPLCPAAMRKVVYGFSFLNHDDVPEKWRKQAAEHYRLGRFPVITDANTAGSAYGGGLREGDELVEVENVPVSGEKGTAEALVRLVGEAAKARRALSLRIMRAGRPVALTIPANDACAMDVVFDHDEQVVNAFADGRRVVVTGGMARFAKSEQELALVVGHEIAHNLRVHIDSQSANAAAGALAGALIDVWAGGKGVNTQGRFSEAAARAGARAYSPEFEAEADYVGLYLMARAGLPIDGAANLWRRIGATSAGSISHGTTHPPTAHRFAALEATVAEIKAKQAKGEPLVPNEKGAQ